jgi:predicted amidophosphoribosyltransferase
MIFCNPEDHNFDQILCLNDYHPYRIEGKRNPHFDDWSSKILDLKNMKMSAIEYFHKILDPRLDAEFSIAIVPSSNSETLDSGIRKLAVKLAANSRTDATSCLVRYKSIDKLATGGNRNREVHLTSIRVQQNYLIQGQEVLLLDDVSTSGNSLLACKALLTNAGAKRVQCLALGGTVKDVINSEDDF